MYVSQKLTFINYYKMNSEQYIKLIQSKNSNLQCISEYTGSRCIMEVKCLNCGLVFKRRADSLKTNCTCPNCVKEQSLNDSKNKFINYLQNHNIELIGTFTNVNTKTTFKCIQCGYIWNTFPYSILSGHGCAKCASHISYKLTTEDFITKAKKVQKNNYNYINTKYINANTAVNIICPIHGEFKILPNNFIKRGCCPKCGIEQGGLSRRYTIEEFVEKAKQIHGNKYDYSKTTYINSEIPTTIICPIHGEFQQTPAHHLKGCGCQKCSYSHGETFIMNYLKNKKLNFQSQYPIQVPKDIRSSEKIYVDFYIKDLNTIIEYNGKQHYVPIEHFGGKVTFESQKNRDNYLRQYCRDNNIKLIEFHYDIDFSIIKEYLDTYLESTEQPPVIIPIDYFYQLITRK